MLDESGTLCPLLHKCDKAKMEPERGVTKKGCWISKTKRKLQPQKKKYGRAREQWMGFSRRAIQKPHNSEKEGGKARKKPFGSKNCWSQLQGLNQTLSSVGVKRKTQSWKNRNVTCLGKKRQYGS